MAPPPHTYDHRCMTHCDASAGSRCSHHAKATRVIKTCYGAPWDRNLDNPVAVCHDQAGGPSLTRVPGLYTPTFGPKANIHQQQHEHRRG